MAKIGSLPDWYTSEIYKKSEDSSSGNAMKIKEFTTTIDKLREENDNLRKEIEAKDYTINNLTLEAEPAKRNLLLKLSLLCEKLKLKSNEDYEA